MPVFTVTCPECRTTLKSPKAIPAGKSLTCPKCSVMFSAPKPKPQEAPAASTGKLLAVVEDIEEIDEEDIEFVEDEGKRKSGGGKEKGPARGRKGIAKRKGMSAAMIAAVVGGILVGVGAFALGGYLIWKNVINAKTELLAYVPEDTIAVLGADIGQISNNATIAQALDHGIKSSPFGQYFQTTSTESKKFLDRIILTGNTNDKGTITVLTKSAIAKDKFVQTVHGSALTQAGQEVFKLTFLGKDSRLLFNSNRSLSLIESSGNDDAIIQGLGKYKPRGELSELINKAAANHLWLVADMNSDMARKGAAAMVPQLAAPGILETFGCVGFWIKFGEPDAMFMMQWEVKDKHGQTMDQIVNNSKAGFDQSKAASEKILESPLVPAQAAPFVNIARQFLNTTTFSASGNYIVIKSRIKMSSLETAIQDGIRGAAQSGR